MVEIATVLPVLGLIVAYLGWKASQLRRPSELEDFVYQSYAGARVFEDAGLMFSVTNVFAPSPGFPERLYKYVSLIKRAGFVDIRFSISALDEPVGLPSVDEITDRTIYPSEIVELRNITWESEPVTQGNFHIRIHSFSPGEVVNLSHATIISIVETITGEIDEQFHAQFTYTGNDD